MTNNDKITFIDLFSGCGGLSEGFLQSGKYDALAHVEWELPMVNTLRNRVETHWEHSKEEANRRVVHFDIQKSTELIHGGWDEETLASYQKTNHPDVIKNGLKGLVGNKKVNIIIGGPPCQAYSIAGRAQDKNSMKDDYRNFLFESFIKVVDHFQPELFVFENVPGMLSASPGGVKVTQRIYKSFSDHGYEIVEPDKLKSVIQVASDFGVPQKRKRVIIIGIRKNIKSSNFNLDSIYSEINKTKISPPKTLFEAIGHLPKLKPSKVVFKSDGRKYSHSPVTGKEFSPVNHEPRYHNNRDIKIFKDWVSNNMNESKMNDKILFYNNLLGKKTKHSKYRSLNWDKPSQTIVAHLNKDGLMFIHPDSDQARTITVKEAALIQSFPNDFVFIEKMGYNYKMIGNAVPPLMAKKISEAIANIINSL
ncbi:DNA cytosine methyltransferase [Flavicella sp.]|uniref:DNA cytosine methyltransferase n=1 Tax=Flavicella sp. TaxID=2957742 RepID=UPI00261383EC|nr:DNA cytosine methyltransferase [Flavicella sp.]MDG1805917.1 DNA cytosine methyltransferase [Flavicella sp.]